MTTLTTLAIETSPGTSTSKPARSIPASIVLWSATIALAAMFVMAGGSKLAGAPAMVQLFDAIGLGQWFRYVTGTIEIGSAILLLIPSLASRGGLLLAATMAGAVITHLFIVPGNPVVPMVLLVASLAIAWARRPRYRVPGGSTRHSSYDGPQFIFRRKS
jgi:putative oxidoreductase